MLPGAASGEAWSLIRAMRRRAGACLPDSVGSLSFMGLPWLAGDVAQRGVPVGAESFDGKALERRAARARAQPAREARVGEQDAHRAGKLAGVGEGVAGHAVLDDGRHFG